MESPGPATPPASDAPVSFSFGKNWQDFLKTAGERSIRSAREDIESWLRISEVRGRRILDAGSGSGIHSFCFHGLGARELVSFDLDPASVEATRGMWERAKRPPTWTVLRGSVLDPAFLAPLGEFDVVYSWGVLHHTGAIWDAVDAAARRVRPGGLLWIALYMKGPRYEQDLELKRTYNAANPAGKRRIERRFIRGMMWDRLRRGKNPFRWNRPRDRGMDAYHDLVDWLGGLPYEVASPEEVDAFLVARGFSAERVSVVKEGACSIYLYRRAP